ncbi:dual specificity protein kinase YAK1 homolog [Physcomitrium patens]|uniref:dual specificity protein kinase YAK1 homolog n=1 Tax=Physcomitrium patens TaxID=3218 RepID=UPI000D15812C|nr:dual specificity protein kinase YAK1 homolog isoform X1 [Physcomitrium patens]XP_024402990.1 dual specificity protein kinase YAK1 homolog isoform X1 [Physcomitrium patens]|eukprot:XP_024402989.1 dual specificity protein kinase YAK1 homolog isoform X1 [Physcomitrella patens]
MPMMEVGACQFVWSPSSDGDYSSDDDDSNSGVSSGRDRRLLYPMPQSHWFPRSFSFGPYVAPGVSRHRSGASAPARASSRQHAGASAPRLHIQVTRSLAYKLTKDIVGTYQNCNLEFAFSPDLNPKRYLTAPSTIVSENGLDNERHDLVLYFNQVLVNDDGTRRYVVKDLVGSGTFGQVAKCYTEETNEYVAVKVIKNLPAYCTQARFEIGILHMLNREYDPNDQYHIVRSLDHFQHHGHLCIVFELLTENLYELLKKTSLKGMSLVLVRMFTKQLLKSLTLLREARVIHCDLKPENILLIESFRSAELKLIDFGSACKEDHTVYTYIQSRFYRSPEVLLGHRYTTAIDMWSLGCVAAELFLGLPLFPGACDFDMLLFMKEKLESQPSDHILRNANFTNRFFKLLTAAPHADHNRSAYQLLTVEEYEVRHRRTPEIGRRYFHGTLAEVIMGYHMKPMSAAEQKREMLARESFVDFLKGLIECDPRRRWSPQQAAQHPFITDEPFTGPYVPVPETPRTPVNRSLLIDHRGAAGHWVGAGLSPQVGGLNSGPRYGVSPQQHTSQFSRASSYGSVGSFGSYGEGVTMDGNFESYMDESGARVMGMNSQASAVGSSPEASWQGRPLVPSIHPQHPVLRSLNLGASPSFNLGASPSGFGHPFLYQQSPGPYGASPGSFPSSPASSFFQSNGSQSQVGSPNRYGPASPARQLLETAVVNANAAQGHFHWRRPWQAPPGSGGHGQQQQVQQQELAHWSRLQHGSGNANADATSNLSFEGQGGIRRGGPPAPHSRGARNSSSSGTAQLQRGASGFGPGTLGAYLSPRSSMDSGEDDSAVSIHWDPDFSDEFLHEDAHETGIRRGPSRSGGVVGDGVFDGTTSRRTSQGRMSTSSMDSIASSNSSQSGYPRQRPGQFSPSQTSPSRLGPQVSQGFHQQRQQGGNQQQQAQHARQQISPEQTPMHPVHQVSRRQVSGDAGGTIAGPALFQQHQHSLLFQQQQLQNANHQQHYGVVHGGVAVSRVNVSQGDPNANAPAATGIAMAAGIGHEGVGYAMHGVPHQRYYGGEELQHQWSIPQNQYFPNELHQALGTEGSWVMFRTKAPDARSTLNEGCDVAHGLSHLSRHGMWRHAEALLV